MSWYDDFMVHLIVKHCMVLSINKFIKIYCIFAQTGSNSLTYYFTTVTNLYYIEYDLYLNFKYYRRMKQNNKETIIRVYYNNNRSNA